MENGVEVSSPIFRDTEEDIKDLYAMCAFLQKCGNFTNERCGGHIHIGANYMEEKNSLRDASDASKITLQAYKNLYEIFGNAEKIFYIISNEEGEVPRQGIRQSAAPVSTEIREAIERGTINLDNEEHAHTFLEQVQDAHKRIRAKSLNITNILKDKGKNTIEFRMSNGSLNSDTLEANKKLFGRLMQVSRDLAEYHPSNEYGMNKIALKERLKEDIPEEEKVEILLELLFREEERDLYRRRYAINSKLLESLPEEKNPLKDFKFSRVDFGKRGYTLGNISQSVHNIRARRPREININEPDTDDREHA